MFSLLKCAKTPINSSIFGSSIRRWITMMTVEQEKAKGLLIRNSFTEAEATKLLRQVEPYFKSADQIEESLVFFKKIQRTEYGAKVKNSEDYQNVFKNVFLYQEPRLLFVKKDFLEERVDKLRDLDFLNGSKDTWKAFCTAPAGYFIQDWSELLKKYYYITFKILPWIDVNFRAPKGQNPIMSCPEVIEIPYNLIKTRFLFAQRVGAKQVMNPKDLTLRNLLLTKPKQFLAIFAPNCTIEELDSLEKLHSTDEGEEDDKLFQELVELAPKQAKKEFFNNLTETFVLSDMK